jgi:hypothetical protein
LEFAGELGDFGIELGAALCLGRRRFGPQLVASGRYFDVCSRRGCVQEYLYSPFLGSIDAGELFLELVLLLADVIRE